MIKFFRKIRQKLLSENKFSKYLFYAIGEIVLVVIGILIALSINTWNQEQLISQKEKTYLKNLETDLELQIASIDIQLTFENNYLSIAQPLLKQFEKDLVLTIDSASSSDLKRLTERKTFVKTDPTYQDLISTGNIGLIHNDVLRNSLLVYYLELERYEKIIQNNNTLHVDELFVNKIMEFVYIGRTSSENLLTHSNKLLEDPTHEMVLINLIDYRESIAKLHIQFMNELKVKTSNMLEVIKEANK